ncbi:hypothetical protein PoB_006728000 [Plakobranchus ocellatus]|uniref:Uncharacterized protein n=1 Tax=Plakobranchus ocellatus TaxID=259542 RepID=A0AAV4D9P3_9GAST|nr:hypothetical protein PoB_006728000 [Plakobranchus ocellatus]
MCGSGAVIERERAGISGPMGSAGGSCVEMNVKYEVGMELEVVVLVVAIEVVVLLRALKVQVIEEKEER